MPRFLLLCLLLALGNGWAVALGQDSPQGHPLFSARFEPADLGLEPQNWAVVQDTRGVIVVGNNRGIATYDGREWRSQPIPNRHVRSLVVDTDGQVFVGGIDEMGQLRPDSLGQLRYESLRHLLPDEDYGEMWNVLAVGNAVVFQGRHHLLFWDGQHFEVVQPGVPVSRTHSVGDTLFVHLRDQPLHRWAGGRLEPIAGTEALAEASLFALHQLPNGGLLIGTRAGEFYCLKMGRLDKLPFDGRAYFERHRPYSFAGLPTETGEIYAIGTIGGGIVLLDQDGRWLDAVPLPEDHWVLDLAFDHQGGLWAALYNGVVRVDVVPSIRRYDAAQGLRGIATEVVAHNGALYATTSQGVFRSSPSGSTWEALLSEHGQAWALGQIGSHLLAATDAGLYDLAGPEPVLVLDEHTYILHEVRGRPGYAYAGLKDGLMLLRVDAAGAWTVLGRVGGVEGDVFSVGQRGDTLWVSLADGGLLLLDLREDLLAPAVAPLPEEDRPEGRLFYTELDGAFAAAGEEGVYRAETKPGGGVRLRPDVALNEALALDGKSYLLLQEVGETLWAVRGRELFLLERTPTGYRRQARPDLPLVDLHITHIASDGPYVWLATEDGLLRYDPTAPKRYDAAYRPLFRRVMRGSRLLFGGAHGQGRLEVAQRPESKPMLAFAREELRFEVAAPSFNAPERIEYQYLLDGFDRDWSAWTTEAVRTYTNLPERALYTFRVRARNVHGIVSEEAQFALRVLPPWYRSIWAYAVYVLLVVVSLWALTAYRVRTHRNELSRERMMGRQLTRINEELASSNERLAEADTLKTSLLQNVSHELRTPLTAMLGSAELLTMHLGEHDPDGESLATSILSSTERLAGTVQDMMDVANLQAGDFVVDPDDVDVGRVLARLVEVHQDAAQQKGLYLQRFPAHLDVPAVLDASVLERIVGHVVSNAIKFTDEGGVSLTLDSDAEHVYVRVTDTGSGMPPERLGHVQEAFTQQSSGHARSHEGVGLGLYIVAAMTERMGGQLHIESEVGRGTTVSVSVPRFDRRGRTREQPRLSAVSAIARGVRLLCVQPDEQRDTAFADRLRKWAEVYVAPSLRTAVSAARLAPYDAVLVQTTQPARALAVQKAIRAVPGYEHIRCILIAETDRVETAAPLFAVLDPDTSSDTVASTIARATDPLALLHTADVSEAEA